MLNNKRKYSMSVTIDTGIIERLEGTRGSFSRSAWVQELLYRQLVMIGHDAKILQEKNAATCTIQDSSINSA